MNPNEGNDNTDSRTMPAGDSLRRMLDLTYELEGLLHLAIGRDDAPARIGFLISAKISELSAFSAPADSLTDEDKKQTVALPEIPAVPVPDNDLPEDEAMASDDDSQEDSYVTEEDLDAEDFSSYDLDDDDPEPFVTPLIPQPEATVTTVGPDRVHVPQPEPERPRQSASAPVFSLNDRFLYSRELFGGRVNDFEAALKEIAAMDSYEEAEEYFITERGFNPELPVVQDFFAVISNYFS